MLLISRCVCVCVGGVKLELSLGFKVKVRPHTHRSLTPRGTFTFNRVCMLSDCGKNERTFKVMRNGGV